MKNRFAPRGAAPAPYTDSPSQEVEDTGYYCFYIDSCIIIPLIILESGKISVYGM